MQIKNLNYHYFDTLILGSGLAGLATAFHLSKTQSIVILSKTQLDSGSTKWAQGGVAAVTDKVMDSFEKHVNDTFLASHKTADLEVVKFVVENGSREIQNWIKLGMPFDLNRFGEFDLTKEAAHSQRRILHAGGDQTGRKIQQFLLQQLQQKSNLKLLPDFFVFKVVSFEFQNQNHFLTLAIHQNKIHFFVSQFLVFSTGGSGQVFAQTTNPAESTGDGLSLARSLNLELSDLEHYQFHPTALKIQEITATNSSLSLDLQDFQNQFKQDFLISESVRGEGAKIINLNNQSFLKKYHPDAELAPRDVVSKSIYRYLKANSKQQVFLDISNFDLTNFMRRFPSIYQKCIASRIDLALKKIPISPSAHYQMGGIKVDLNSESSLKNVFAVGEVSCTGLHGANRLASNSLLEAIVFAKSSSKEINSRVKQKTAQEIQKIKELSATKEVKIQTLENQEIVVLTKAVKTIKTSMWEYLGVIRDFEKLDSLEMVWQNLEQEYSQTWNKINPLSQTVKHLFHAAKVISEQTIYSNPYS